MCNLIVQTCFYGVGPPFVLLYQSLLCEKVENWYQPPRGHIVAHDVSWARKRAGHKMNVGFPCCASGETFVADTKCF